MAKIQEAEDKDKNKVVKVTGLDANNIEFSNILDSKLAQKGLSIKDIQNGR